MSCTYFTLYKEKSDSIFDNTKDIVFHCPNKIVHILPYNNFDYYTKYGLFESGLIDFCKKFSDKNKIFLDIGAHSGTYSLSLSSYFKEVYSFEPQKMTFYSLCGSVALSNINNITCLNFGLGSKEQEGNITLNIVSNDGGGSTVQSTKQPILRTEKISIKTLDSLNLDNIGFIKMDVEENELDVLKGSICTLKRSNFPKILFESNIKNEDLFNFLNKLGYNILTLQNVNNMYLAEYKN